MPGAGVGAARSGGWRSGSGLRRPSAFRPGSAGGGGAGRREPGPAEAARSLTPRGAPGAEAAAAAQADNELASAPSRGRFEPRVPRPSLPSALRRQQRGRPLAAGPDHLRAPRAPGTPQKGLPGGGAGARMPPLWLERMQPERGDRGPGEGVVALRTAGRPRGAHAAGHARAGCPEEQPQESESGRPHAAPLWKLQAEDGRTDTPVLSPCERALGGGGGGREFPQPDA